MDNNRRYLVVNVINANEFKLECFYTQAERKKFLEQNNHWKKCTWEQLQKLQKTGFSRIM